MKIDDIRPKNLEEGQKTAYLKDVDFYRSKINLFINRNCPCCNLNSSVDFAKKDGFSYVKCQSCNSIYMNPGPPKHIVDELYEISENYKYWAQYIYPVSKNSRMKSLHDSRSKWIYNNLVSRYPQMKTFSILEIGAGTGDTLRSLLDSFPSSFTVKAFEPNPSMHTALEKNGIELFDLNTQAVDGRTEKFDAVICFEVLEHLLNPLELLKTCKQILKNNGLFLATTPNSQSLEVQLLKEKSTTLDIEHITILSPASIHALAHLSGYRVLEISTPGVLDVELLDNSGIELWVRAKTKPLDNFELQKMISLSGFSSHQRLILKNS